jgi:SAM-dependent methyltransferase
MSQHDSGIRRILSDPRVYRGWKRVIASDTKRREWIDRYIAAKDGDRVLDIGCGPGVILESLPRVQYTGVDVNEKYIAEARRRYGHRASFHAGRVTTMTAASASFEIVLALGLMHHLDDQEVAALCRIAHHALVEGGHLITLDGAYIGGQSPVARFLISRDRGRHIRSPDGYRTLVEAFFPKCEMHIRHDLNRFPYTHAILRCTKS